MAVGDRPPGAPDAFLTIPEIVDAARRRLPPHVWDFSVGGSESETTLRRNRAAFDGLAFRPRVLRDVSRVDLATTFLGHPLSLPVMLAPVGSIAQFDPDGALAAARAAERTGTASFVAGVSSPSLEEVRAGSTGPLAFQLYVRGDDAWVDEWVRRAVDHGYRAFCLTVDTAMYSRRERDLARRFVKPWRKAATGLEYQAALSWDQVKRFKDAHPGFPLVLKGIATAEDADLACRHGVDVVYVSNHGGRQLDHGLGSAAVLPGVVAAVGGRAQVWVDGGFVRGTDIVKAIALGATTVGLGRLPCMGLAAAGEAGLVRVLELLEEEVRICLGLLGVTRLADLDPSYLQAAPAVSLPDVTSAFPLLDEDGY